MEFDPPQEKSEEPQSSNGAFARWIPSEVPAFGRGEQRPLVAMTKFVQETYKKSNPEIR